MEKKILQKIITEKVELESIGKGQFQIKKIGKEVLKDVFINSQVLQAAKGKKQGKYKIDISYKDSVKTNICTESSKLNLYQMLNSLNIKIEDKMPERTLVDIVSDTFLKIGDDISYEINGFITNGVIDKVIDSKIVDSKVIISYEVMAKSKMAAV